MKMRDRVGLVFVVATIPFLMLATACVGGIDESLNSPISNNDTYATIGHLWDGARSAILREREPSTDKFNLSLSFALPCTRGGTASYQGSLAGTKSGGAGGGTLALAGALAGCEFDDITTVRKVSAPSVTFTGTVAIAGDTWSSVNVHMVASTATINGVACPGGIDVIITAAAPSAQATSTGNACGRAGTITLP